MRSARILFVTAAATITLAVLNAPAFAADASSRIQFVTGDVTVIRADGTAVPAVKGGVIGPGDRLVTGPNGMAQVRASDQGVVALRANSECRFEQQGGALDVALMRGQLRTVTDLGGETKGLINVSTPDARLAVGDGDVETGVKPDAADGGAGESFSQVHTGVIRVDGVKGGGLTLQPGQLAKVGAVGPVLITDKPSFVQPILPLPTVSGGKPSSASLGTLVSNETPKTGFPTQTTPGFQTGVLTALGDKGLATTVEPPAVKLPEVRLEFASANVIGASSAVNTGLSSQTFLVGGRLGSNDKVITPTATTIDPTRVTTSVSFKPTTVQLGNGQTISAIEPAGGSKLVTTSGVADKIVLLPDTLPAPTPSTVLSNTTLNTLNTGNTINPKVTTTTPKINIGVLPKLR
jgi:hypothetical protein